MTPFFLAALLSFADSTPRHGDIVLFVGDSITQAGDYVADVEAYLLSCRPADYFRIINVGKSSETVSGTSEPDHHPPRPCIHDRFARDVAAFKPDIVVACYGMNDGNYFPYDPARFEKYKAGMTRFIDRVFKETPARALVLLTPPAFDASKAPPAPQDGKSFGYKHPSRDYDFTLRKYADWLLTLKSDRIDVVDVHRAFNAYLRAMHGGTWLSPDAVHPDHRGHWLIAQCLLSEWSIRLKWKELTLDFQRPHASLAWQKGRVTPDVWTWNTPKIESPVALLLPFAPPQRPLVARGMIAEELFDQRIQIKGLPEGLFDVQAFASTIEKTNAKTLQEGVNLLDRGPWPDGVSRWIRNTKSEDLPRKSDLLDLVQERRRRISSAWLAAQKDKPFTDLNLSVEVVSKAEDEARSLSRSINDALKPRSFEILITQSYQPP